MNGLYRIEDNYIR